MLGKPCYNKASHWQSRVHIIGRVEGLACICKSFSEFDEHGSWKLVWVCCSECLGVVDRERAEADSNFCLVGRTSVRRECPVHVNKPIEIKVRPTALRILNRLSSIGTRAAKIGRGFESEAVSRIGQTFRGEQTGRIVCHPVPII